MSIPIKERLRFRSNDLELLKTGQFSDAQVMVGDRVWKVHKSILCLRSGYFKNQPFEFQRLVGDNWTPIPDKLPADTTERQAEMLLEFIYSGSIERIHDIPMHGMVELSRLGQIFLVDEMVEYAHEHLWARLEAKLQIVLTKISSDGTVHVCHTANSNMNGGLFLYHFRTAVRKACLEHDEASQKVLADFVWAARGKLLDTPIMEHMNTAFPLFGSRVLTTLIKGPQSPFLKSDAVLECDFCSTNPNRQGHNQSQALQLFQPEST